MTNNFFIKIQCINCSSEDVAITKETDYDGDNPSSYAQLHKSEDHIVYTGNIELTCRKCGAYRRLEIADREVNEE